MMQGIVRWLAGAAAAVALGWISSAAGVADAGCIRTVDASAGPYRTIQAAIDDLPASGPCEVAIKAGTYAEQVVVAGRNLGARDERQRLRVKADGAVILDPPADFGIVIGSSRFVTIEGLTIAGAARAAVLLDGGDGVLSDVTIARNDLHNNGDGIVVSANTAGAWIVNNLVRNNARDGIALRGAASGGASAYVVNNTIVGNGWNGIHAARDADTALVNNLIVGNGAAAGQTGGRWGILRERSAGAGRPDLFTLVHNVLYANGTVSGPQRGDLGHAAQMLDDRDSGNATTTGEAGTRCTFAHCNAAAAFRLLFDPPGFGPTFRLVTRSPAGGAGVSRFERDGRNWVPGEDFEGDPRSQEASSPVDAGYDERQQPPAQSSVRASPGPRSPSTRFAR